jgi:hypothetical protein
MTQSSLGGAGADRRSPSGPPAPEGRSRLIERKQLDGTCVNNGCIPTQALIASAEQVTNEVVCSVLIRPK